jgi:XTP/dITP diphosphohydrolase
MPARILLATNNSGKLNELRSLLEDIPLELLTPADLGLNLKVEEKAKATPKMLA